jgi:CBS domain-containing protein
MPSTDFAVQPVHGSFLTPRFEDARVYDAMRKGIFTCDPDTSLRDVARLMATHHIHSVVVTSPQGDTPWGLVTDIDLARAAGSDLAERTAGETAAAQLVTVSSDDTLARAAQLMAEHDTAHLVVVHAVTGKPTGVVSTLDVAGVLAWGEG